MATRLLTEPARLAGASLLRLQSDERLAVLAQEGHEAAFDAIVHRYRASLVRYCGGIVGAGRADDAVQQALINAHAALSRTPDVRHLRSWLYRIAHNASLNMLRAIRDDAPLEALGAGGETPHEAYERTERLRSTLAAVRDLPERQRAALVLRELEGRSHEEIASALGTTTGGARQSLARARTAVRHAATAITPYPLIAKLAAAMTANPGGSPVAEAVAGAGAGVTIAKLTAGIAATGALVGGGVAGTGFVRNEPPAPRVEQAQAKDRPARAGHIAARPLAVAIRPIAGTAPAVKSTSTAPPHGAAKHRDGEHHTRPSGSESSGSRDDESSSDGSRGSQTSGDDHRGAKHSGGERTASSDDRHGNGSGSSDDDDGSTSPAGDEKHRGLSKPSDSGTPGSAPTSSGSGSHSSDEMEPPEDKSPEAPVSSTTAPDDSHSGPGSPTSGSPSTPAAVPGADLAHSGPKSAPDDN
jgi:RNA polymerase sigma factor (sigma-70 family)